jgi:hypothetical protein
VSADSDARNGAIGDDENGTNRVDILLNLSRNSLHVELVLPNVASVGQPRLSRIRILEKCYAHSPRSKCLLTSMPFLLLMS